MREWAGARQQGASGGRATRTSTATWPSRWIWWRWSSARRRGTWWGSRPSWPEEQSSAQATRPPVRGRPSILSTRVTVHTGSPARLASDTACVRSRGANCIFFRFGFCQRSPLRFRQLAGLPCLPMLLSAETPASAQSTPFQLLPICSNRSCPHFPCPQEPAVSFRSHSLPPPGRTLPVADTSICLYSIENQ